MELYLLRYGEIGTKSASVRKHFEDILVQNIERMFLKEDREVIIERERGRLFAYADEDGKNIFSRTFGLVSFSPAVETSSDMGDILKEGKKFAEGKEGTFAVRSRRIGDHDYDSQELAAELGDAVLEENPSLEVDLDEPGHELHVEVRNDSAYVFTEIYDGPGGLPLSTQGKVAAFVENTYDFLATWLMMRRGARAAVYTPDYNSWIEELDRWDPNLRFTEGVSKNEFFGSDLPDHIQGIVLGERFDDISEDFDEVCPVPIYRPLIGFDKRRIEDHFSKIEKLDGKSDLNISTGIDE